MVALNLRKAQQKHLDDIMVIVHDAQQNLKNADVDQWQDGYPDKSNILSDINQGILYEIIFNNKLVGIMAIQYTPEPNYQSLSGGKWHAQGPYATIHRFAISSNFAHQHLGKLALTSALTLIKNNHITAVRIDTHETNLRMQHLLKQLGFHYRGIIHISDPHGDLNTNAYELIMS
ncbi:GNAT family N-acetyltransferase [Weissella bombi]|uniref:Ribosomal protein S18 acetylase RimI n=1 Tax=Weissella bombi TaxID=1505725 RepID=A0A1C4BXR5_9LACO|nr:GNAT family N-acetyltransferase [Weissella bombi]SCC11716.1 Ribosomal protein S18 acetylase RimI [Weissella bombi]